MRRRYSLNLELSRRSQQKLELITTCGLVPALCVSVPNLFISAFEPSADNPDILEYEKNRAEDLKDKGEIFYTNYCAQKRGQGLDAPSPWMERSFGP